MHISCTKLDGAISGPGKIPLHEWRPRMIIGYARVSTDGQTLDAQQTTLKAAGAEKVFAEKVSGAQTDRKALAKAY